MSEEVFDIFGDKLCEGDRVALTNKFNPRDIFTSFYKGTENDFFVLNPSELLEENYNYLKSKSEFMIEKTRFQMKKEKTYE